MPIGMIKSLLRKDSMPSGRGNECQESTEMQPLSRVRTLAKILLSVNLAALIRAVRCGPADAMRRLSGAAFSAINPFGQPEPSRSRDDLRRIPEVPLSAVLRNRPIIRVDGTYAYTDGSLPYADIAALLSILVDRNPSCVLEIGTFNGGTTRLMALNLPSAAIHTVDLPEEYDNQADSIPLPKDDFHLLCARSVGIEHRSDPKVSNVVQHFGDTASWDFAQANGATFIFIDASHTYEYVRNDTEKALAASRGREVTLLWHDCDPRHPGVTRWLAEMVQLEYPVKRIKDTNLATMDSPA